MGRGRGRRLHQPSLPLRDRQYRRNRRAFALGPLHRKADDRSPGADARRLGPGGILAPRSLSRRLAAQRRRAFHAVRPRLADWRSAQARRSPSAVTRGAEDGDRRIGARAELRREGTSRLPLPGDGNAPVSRHHRRARRADFAVVAQLFRLPAVFPLEGNQRLRPERARLHGYGKTWMRLDNKDLGGGPLKDIVACKWWLVANADVADDKVVVMGGSYGGYMALAAEAFAPEEFVANVDYFGVSDLKTLVESFPPYWAAFSTFIYQKFGNPADPKDAAYQHDRSPINFTAQMKRPLLVVQGDHDARVKKGQSDRIVESLRARKVPVHYLVLTNEGHGFSRTDSLLRAIQATDAFIDRYVLGDSKAQVPGG